MCDLNDKDMEFFKRLQLFNKLSNIDGINTLVLCNDMVYIPIPAKDKLSCIDCCFYDQCNNKSNIIKDNLPCKNNKLNIPIIFKKTQMFADFLDKDIYTFILNRI